MLSSSAVDTVGASRFRIGDLVVDFAAGSVQRDGESIPLARLTFALLEQLVAHAPETVKSEELIERLWPDVVVGEENLKQRVLLLRRALGDDADSPRYVETVRGWGYRLAAKVEPIDEAATGSSTDAPQRRSRLVPIVALGAAAVAGLTLWKTLVPTRAEDPPQAPPDFIRLETEELENRARSLLQNFGDPEALELSLEAWEELASLRPDHAAAYAGMAAARTQLVWNTSPAEDQLGRAQEEAERSLELDPELAEGYMALSYVFFLRGLVESGEELSARSIELAPEDPWVLQMRARLVMEVLGRYGEAEVLARRATLADDSHYPAWFQLGWAQLELERLDEAAASFDKAIDLRPDFGSAHFGLGVVNAQRGKFDRAIEHYDRALAIDPNSSFAHFLTGVAWHHLAKPEKALASFETVVNLDTPHATKPYALLYSGVEQRALGNESEAEALIDRAEHAFKTNPEIWANSKGLAGVAMARGQREAALDWLDRARESGLRSIVQLTGDPALEPLESDERFRALITEIRSERGPSPQSEPDPQDPPRADPS